MSQWPSTRSRRVLAALKRIGWMVKRSLGPHRTLSKEGYRDFVFIFHGMVGVHGKVAVGKIFKEGKILAGGTDENIGFPALCQLLILLGFDERIKGVHHIFTRSNVAEIINLQPKGSKAKPYPVKQVRNILVKYRLGESDVD